MPRLKVPAPGGPFTKSQLAAITGVSSKAFHNWVERGLVHLDANQVRKQAWRRYGMKDVFRVAVIQRLIRFGMTIPEASELVEAELDAVPGTAALCIRSPGATPGWALMLICDEAGKIVPLSSLQRRRTGDRLDAVLTIRLDLISHEIADQICNITAVGDSA